MIHSSVAAFICPSRRESKAYPKPTDGTFVANNYGGIHNTSSDNSQARIDYAASAGGILPYVRSGPGNLQAGNTSWCQSTNCPDCWVATTNPARPRELRRCLLQTKRSQDSRHFGWHHCNDPNR